MKTLSKQQLPKTLYRHCDQCCDTHTVDTSNAKANNTWTCGNRTFILGHHGKALTGLVQTLPIKNYITQKEREALSSDNSANLKADKGEVAPLTGGVD